MRYVAVGLAGIFMLTGCAGLLTPSGSAKARWAALETSRAAEAAGASGGERICKNMSVIGSNFPKKICSTAEEWKAFDEQQQQTADDFDRARRAGNTDSAFEQ